MPRVSGRNESALLSQTDTLRRQEYTPTAVGPADDQAGRTASKLEAEYIAAEAGGDAGVQLALINRQRQAANQPAYAGATDASSVLFELFNQKALDFWLEGKRMADWRRQPVAASRNVPVAGSAYWRTGFGSVGTQTCYPIPRTETDNNPNFKKP